MFHDIGSGNDSLGMTSKAQARKVKVNKTTSKLKTSVHPRTQSGERGAAYGMGENSGNHMSDKG